MFATFLLFSFALGSLGAWMIAHFARGLSLIDYPNERSSHSQPTPRGGGVGIFATFSVIAVITGISPWFWGPIFALSLLAGYGDWVELPARPRLLSQLALIGSFVIGTWQTTSISPLHLPLILFWIVFIAGTANFYNFMDGINGIAGITGAIGFSLLAFYLSGPGGQLTLSILALCVAFSCLGFLPFNMPKARVFMGDIGSILLGGVFAGLIYLASHTILDFLCMASFLFPFYADELVTMAVRLKNRENLTRAHRKHIYQLLANEKKIPHWQVSLGFGCVQLIVGISILLTKDYGVPAVLGILALYFSLFILVSGYFRSCIKRVQAR